MKILLVAVVGPLIFLPTNCHGQTAEEMASACRSTASDAKVVGDQVRLPTDFDSGVCWGAFAMVQQMTRVAKLENGKYVPAFGICSPDESTRTELIKIFEQFVDKHPARLHEEFWVVAQASLREAFPCKA